MDKEVAKEGTSRGRTSKNESKAPSRASSRSSSTSSSVKKSVKKDDKKKIKGILAKGTKSPKPIRKKSKKGGRDSSASSMSSGPSGYATPKSADYESDASGKGGLHQPMANLQYALHTALSNKGEDEKRLADQLLRGDSNKKLIEAFKNERVKGAQMFASLMDSGLNTSDQDVPQFKPFNKKKSPCSPEEFDRQLKAIMRNFPRFEGRCSEFLYFLLELEALRNTANVTDDQLIRVLQNRLAGRLLKYFKNEMNREKNVVAVLNRLGRDYVEVVDVAAEVEKCATFKFQFKNMADELIRLKEIMSLAYPHMPIESLKQAYIQKVTDKLPTENRLALVEEFERQRIREEAGFSPLTNHEIDAKIIRHCRALERKPIKPVFQVKASSRGSEYSESDASETFHREAEPMKNEHRKSQKAAKNEVKDFIRSVKQIAEKAAQQIGNKVVVADQRERRVEGGNYAAKANMYGGGNNARNFRDPNPQRQMKPLNRYENQKKIFPPPNPNFMRQAPPRRMERKDGFQRPPFQQQPNGGPQGGPQNRPKIFLANPRDPHYMDWIKEAQEANQVKYMGQKIKHDFQNATDNFKEILKQTREPLGPYENQPFYHWKDGKYSVETNPEINYPVMRKVGNGVPQLSSEIMKRFNRCCYACGDPQCPRKGRKARYECAYQNKADSWMPCERCMRGFHLKKDCMALLKN